MSAVLSPAQPPIRVFGSRGCMRRAKGAGLNGKVAVPRAAMLYRGVDQAPPMRGRDRARCVDEPSPSKCSQAGAPTRLWRAITLYVCWCLRGHVVCGGGAARHVHSVFACACLTWRHPRALPPAGNTHCTQRTTEGGATEGMCAGGSRSIAATRPPVKTAAARAVNKSEGRAAPGAPPEPIRPGAGRAAGRPVRDRAVSPV